jgi:hypothetical protein
VSCTLRLLKNYIRTNPNVVDGYAHAQDDTGVWTDDPRFVESNIPFKAIATSNAQNDSGVFELSFRDERYLPFEGAGAVSEWSLELFSDTSPNFGKPLRQFTARLPMPLFTLNTLQGGCRSFQGCSHPAPAEIF